MFEGTVYVFGHNKCEVVLSRQHLSTLGLSKEFPMNVIKLKTVSFYWRRFSNRVVVSQRQREVRIGELKSLFRIGVIRNRIHNVKAGGRVGFMLR